MSYELECGGCVCSRVELIAESRSLKSLKGDLRGLVLPTKSFHLCLTGQTHSDEEFLVNVRRACDDGSV